MSRYLAPSKICVLVLVKLYCEGDVPTSATIPLLSFIVPHILPRGSAVPLGSQNSTPQKAAASIKDFEDVTAGHASRITGRTVYDLFVRGLWALDSLDAMHDFFYGLHNLLERTREELERETELGISQEGSMLLSRTSPLGIFVRRAELEYARMQLHDTSKLWTAYLKYRSSTAATYQKRNTGDGRVSLDANLDGIDLNGSALMQVVYGDLDEDLQSDEIYSTEDVERVLEFQADRLQSSSSPLHDIVDC